MAFSYVSKGSRFVQTYELKCLLFLIHQFIQMFVFICIPFQCYAAAISHNKTLVR